jgi:chromosomal replication initiation ATPase DnaA
LQITSELYIYKSSPLDDLRYGLYLGSEEFSGECIRRIKGAQWQEKPQIKSLLRGRNIKEIVFKILVQLGEREPDVVAKSKRRTQRPTRDVAIYILSRLGVYTNKEIGGVFGVRYTAITGTIKRAEQYLKQDKQMNKIAQEIINNI